jgi:transaldolase
MGMQVGMMLARHAASPAEDGMNATERVHDLGQSIWLDNITRELLDSGRLSRYIEDLGVTGLTSNPTIFHQAIQSSADYDAAIRADPSSARAAEALFFDLALEDLGRAADLFRTVYDRTCGVDGWVSLEVSPLLAHDAANTLAAAEALHARAHRPNLFIKIPGTPEGLPAIEAAIFAGVPVNVTLLFSREHYLAAAEACLRGLERRIAAGLAPDVASVASLFISRWDTAVSGQVPEALKNRLGIAIGRNALAAYRDLMASPRWLRAFNAGARPQRLVLASTGTKDPAASNTLYVDALIAPLTVNTMPEATLLALAGREDAEAIPQSVGEDSGNSADGGDGGDCEAALAEFTQVGVDLDALAARLQAEGAAAFARSWQDLMALIASKRHALGRAE